MFMFELKKMRILRRPFFLNLSHPIKNKPLSLSLNMQVTHEHWKTNCLEISYDEYISAFNKLMSIEVSRQDFHI